MQIRCWLNSYGKSSRSWRLVVWFVCAVVSGFVTYCGFHFERYLVLFDCLWYLIYFESWVIPSWIIVRILTHNWDRKYSLLCRLSLNELLNYFRIINILDCWIFDLKLHLLHFPNLTCMCWLRNFVCQKLEKLDYHRHTMHVQFLVD